jgi:[acyl-carrier-protein] S-malonyltransferase
VDVSILESPEQIKDALVRQAAKPVRWLETIRTMADRGVTQVVECGPGKVLAGLTKRIDDRLQGMAITDETSLMDALQQLKT